MTAPPLELELRAADGPFRAWLHGAVPGAPRPGLVLVPDAYGARSALQAMAARAAALGYAVLLPDVFYRNPGFAPVDIATVWGDAPERARLMALMQTLTPERIRADGAAWLEALAARPEVRADRLGAFGYCMGGRLAFLTAAYHAGRLRAAACFHAGGLVSDAADSPHTLAPRLGGALYLGVADQDRSCTPEHQGALATALGAAGVDYAMELYAGKRHGFAVPDNAGAYDAEAAERHWQRLEGFFRERLA